MTPLALRIMQSPVLSVGGFVVKAGGDDKPLWIWNDRLRRYQRFDKGRRGRIIGFDEMVGLRDRFMDTNTELVQTWFTRAWEGQMSMDELQDKMTRRIIGVWSDQYALAKGGRFNMTEADWEVIAGKLDFHLDRLDRFLGQMEDGKYNEEQLNAVLQRAGLYMEATGEAFELGRMAAFDMGVLPIYPKSGDTVCKMNCRCSLEINEGEAGWEVIWNLGLAKENCPDCLDMAGDWTASSPYVVPYPPNHWILRAKQKRGRPLQIVV